MRFGAVRCRNGRVHLGAGWRALEIAVARTALRGQGAVACGVRFGALAPQTTIPLVRHLLLEAMHLLLVAFLFPQILYLGPLLAEEA